MSFVPVYLGSNDCISQANESDALQLPPATLPVRSLEPRDLTDRWPGSDELDRRDLADDLESQYPWASR